MELSRLAAKQQRLKSWAEFANTQVSDPLIKQETMNLLELYQAALARCWKNNNVASEDIQELEDLERKLNELNERARLSYC